MADGPPDKLVELYRARGLPEAQALFFRLEEAGIPARIDNELLQGVIGEIPAGWNTAPRILVARDRREAAQSILQEFLAPMTPAGDESNDAGDRCLSCGATMATADTCPVCGWSFAADPTSELQSQPPQDETQPATLSTSQTDPRQGPGPPPLTGRAAWLEVAAVLAVGVVPNLLSAITILAAGPFPGPYWVDAFQLTGLSLCTSFVTLYLIQRSGEPWTRFGLERPTGWDIPLGFGMLVVVELVMLVYWRFGQFTESGSSSFPVPRTQFDYAMMVVSLGTNAFAEELVTRAYLITRLEVLLRSRGKAVILAAAAFASYHCYQGFGGVLFALMMGLSFGLAYLGVRRVWPFAIGHALYGMHAEMSHWS